jgi:hypothetical protein
MKFLATGTSHIEFGIYCKGEPRIYNWGASGQSFGYEHALLVRYLDKIENLKVAFIEVSETRLLIDDSLNQWYSNVYWIHYKLPYNVNIWNPQSYFHISQAYEFFKPIVFKTIGGDNGALKLDEQGYAVENHEGRFELLNFDSKKIDSTFTMVYDFKINDRVIEDNVHHLLGTIQILKSKGIRVILIHPPFYKTFISAIPQEWVSRSKQVFEKIAISEGIPFWDYTSIIKSRQECFFNDNHLNITGAQVWTQMILDSLQKMD